jgi:hypothetical protein
MILVTTSRRSDPLSRRLGRDIAFASGGRYIARGKGGLSRPPLCEGTVLVICRDGRGIGMQVLDGAREMVCLRFSTVREGPRAGLLRRGFFTGNPGLLSCLSPYLPIHGDGDLPDTLAFDGIQGRRVSLGVCW